jgi:hypothetical protein
MGHFGDIFRQLGPIKNPVLGSASTFSIALLYFSRDLLLDKQAFMVIITGIAMHFFAVVVFLVALGFYIFAFFRLPSSIQESVFLDEARAAIARHNRKSSKVNTKKALRNG